MKTDDDAKAVSNQSFARKLRMMRADLFALLCVADRIDFLEDRVDAQTLQRNVLQFLQGEYNERVKNMYIFKQLKGWNRVLFHKCNENQREPIYHVNAPECVQHRYAAPVEDGADHYVFGTFLEPGHHQFIIYDPLLGKAFCQEFVIELDLLQELYPEFSCTRPPKPSEAH